MQNIKSLSKFLPILGTGLLVVAVIILLGKTSAPKADAQILTLDGPPSVICISNTFSCGVDNLVAQRFKGKNMANVLFAGARYSDENGTMINLSSTSFRNAIMSTVVDQSRVDGPVDFSNDNFTGAIFQNMIGTNSVNFTNANFTNANLNGSSWGGTATVTGATWSNTICPDGTNSNNDGNTCVGHGF